MPERKRSGSDEKFERVGPGGEVGEGQAGQPLHKPKGRRNRELGERERVGAGGPVGRLSDAETTKGQADFSQATREVVEEEISRGITNPGAEPDQKGEIMNQPEDRIREQAYFLWESEGCPEGRAEIHWLEAKRLLEGARSDPNESQRRSKDESGATVDEQIDDSFPASDPPSYNAGGRVGRPDRSKK